MVRLPMVIIATLLLFACGIPIGLAAPADGGKSQVVRSVSEKVSPRMPIITVLYDNNPHDDGMKTAWGFSCVVKGMEKTVLFDAGGDGRLLLSNMRKLGVAPQKIDAVVISHRHGDHVGGLLRFLKENRQAVTYLPETFPEVLVRHMELQGSKVVDVRGPTEICHDFFSIGEAGAIPREQALVVRTGRGLVIVTGCAHPGIERVVRMAQGRFGGAVLLVLGGFHLAGSSKSEIENVVAGVKKLGVRHVAPCHCTGDAARRFFKEAYGSGFIDVGVGKILDTEELR